MPTRSFGACIPVTAVGASTFEAFMKTVMGCGEREQCAAGWRRGVASQQAAWKRGLAPLKSSPCGRRAKGSQESNGALPTRRRPFRLDASRRPLEERPQTLWGAAVTTFVEAVKNGAPVTQRGPTRRIAPIAVHRL